MNRRVKLEEMLQNTDWIQLNKQQRGYVESYVRVMQKTGGLGRTVYDCYKEPSKTKQEVWEHWKSYANADVHSTSACFTIITYSKHIITVGWLEYTGHDKMFYLHYITPTKRLCLPFDSRFIIDLFYSKITMRGQLTDEIRQATCGTVEIEQE